MKLNKIFTFALGMGVALYIGDFLLGFPDIYLLWAVPIVFVYGLIVLFKYRDEVGSSDSIYYLGFIFTLLALFFSLLPMVIDDTKLDPGKILASFSVALSTTVVGLIFRTFAVQFSTISETDLEDSNQKLVEATRELVLNVKTITTQLEDASGEMESGFRHMVDNLKSASTSFSENIEETIKDAGQTIKAASEDYQESLLESSRQHANVSDTMIKSITNSIATCDDVVSEYRETLSEVGSILNNLTTGNSEAYSRIEAEIGSLSEKVYTATESISSNIQDLSIKTVENVSVKMQEQLSSFQGNLPNIDGMVISLSKTVDTVNQYNQSLDTMIKKAESRIEASTKALDSVVDYGGAIEGLTKNVSVFADSSRDLKVLLDQFTSDFTQVKQVNAELNKLVIESSRSVVREIKKEMQS